MNESKQEGQPASIEILSAEEGRALIDERAQDILGISGTEFVQRYRNGELTAAYHDPAHHVALNRLVMLLPFWHED